MFNSGSGQVSGGISYVVVVTGFSLSGFEFCGGVEVLAKKVTAGAGRFGRGTDYFKRATGFV